MRKFTICLIPVAMTVLFTACQAVFTYTPFSFLQRDISTRPAEEQITRAKEVLGSGDTAQMAAALKAIETLLKTNDDPELYLLAADLAFGASGMTEVFTEALQDLDALSTGTPDTLLNVLDSLDLGLISKGASYVNTAVGANAEVTDTQYIIAGAALLTSAVEKAGGFENIGSLTSGDPGYQDLQDAEAFLTAGGASDLLTMFNL